MVIPWIWHTDPMIHFAFIALLLTAASCFDANEQIQNLPKASFNITNLLYSGYINDQFYWFTSADASSRGNETALFYLSAEKGCSALGSLFKEAGMFRFDDNGNLAKNDFSWTKFTNIAVLENPENGGFSLNISSDKITLANSLLANLVFLKAQITEYNPAIKDFFVYASGFYINLVSIILAVNDVTQLGIKGVIFANPNFIRQQYNSLIPLSYAKGVVSKAHFDAIMQACSRCTRSLECDFLSYESDSTCRRSADDLNESVQSAKSETFYPKCAKILAKKNWTSLQSQNPEAFDASAMFDGYGCGDLSITIENYFNMADVQREIHVKNTKQLFEFCRSSTVLENSDELLTNFKKAVIKQTVPKIKFLVLSGDTSIKSNHIGIWNALQTLGLNILKTPENWHFSYNSQMYKPAVAGRIAQFEGLDFITIKGAGYNINMDRPAQVFQIVNNFLHDLNYDSDVSGFGWYPSTALNSPKARAELFSKRSVSQKQGDKIQSLPLETYNRNLNQYSGYLNGLKTHKLHYWFVESVRSNAPLILWLNGGPGDSSMQGMFYEYGPYLFDHMTTHLLANEFGWHMFANMLFIESPVKVGYSYALDPQENVELSDDLTMEENYAALLNFLELYPTFKGRDFYVAGESHGGVYVPMLAAKIANRSAAAPGEFKANLKGIAVANGLIDYSDNIDTMFHVMYYHGIMPLSEYQDLLSACCVGGNEFNCKFSQHIDWPNFPNPKSPNDTCMPKLIDVTIKYYLNSGSNAYSIYQDCYRDFADTFRRPQKGFPQTRSNPFDGYWCTMIDSLKSYMTRADTRKALHIPEDLPAWQNTSIENDYKKTQFTMAPFFQVLSRAGVRTLIFNGDVDLHCNHLGAEWFAAAFAEQNHLNKTKIRQPWYYQLLPQYEKQIAGYFTRYGDYFDVITIQGAGHVAGTDRPGQTFQMMYNFIHRLDYSMSIMSANKNSANQTFRHISLLLILSFIYLNTINDS